MEILRTKDQPINIHRNRLLYSFLILATIALGLISRSIFIPDLIYPYLGDLLYTLMVYWIIAFLYPSQSPVKVALISVLICFLIEVSQLYQAEWINAIRESKLGGLILGYGFLWSDLVSYLAGGVLGMTLEYLMLRRQSEQDSRD